MANCKKMPFPSKGAAITFHQIRSRKPYYVYQCAEHYPDWHITTTGLHQAIIDQIVEIIQGRPADRASLGKISNKRRLYIVRHPKGIFVVVYHKTQATVDVLYEAMPGDTFSDVLEVVSGIIHSPVKDYTEAEALFLRVSPSTTTN